jgi:hypothetical protein
MSLPDRRGSQRIPHQHLQRPTVFGGCWYTGQTTLYLKASSVIILFNDLEPYGIWTGRFSEPKLKSWDSLRSGDVRSESREDERSHEAHDNAHRGLQKLTIATLADQVGSPLSQTIRAKSTNSSTRISNFQWLIAIPAPQPVGALSGKPLATIGNASRTMRKYGEAL